MASSRNENWRNSLFPQPKEDARNNAILRDPLYGLSCIIILPARLLLPIQNAPFLVDSRPSGIGVPSKRQRQLLQELRHALAHRERPGRLSPHRWLALEHHQPLAQII